MSSLSLTTLDIVILVLGGLSILLGLWRGLVRTLFGLAAWAISLFASPFLAQVLGERFDWSWSLSLGLSFLAIFMAMRLIGSLTARALVKVGLSSVDRLLGALFGCARALLVIGLLATIAHSFKLDKTATWREAACAPLLDGIVQWVEPMLPERFGGPTKI
jgi:membrane protein required for colicin V production